MANLKHGHAKNGKQHPLYTMWCNMRRRCDSGYSTRYYRYGGRGIKVYSPWDKYFMAFYLWATHNGWEEGLILDRENVDKDYCPENCRFVTSQISSTNQALLPSHNSSGYRGVSYAKKDDLYYAYISIGNKKKHLGCFKSPRLAALRYDVEAFLLDDERPMNFIDRV